MSESTLPTETPGQVLAAARVRAGLTVGELAERSRVPVSAIEAIDADDINRMPARVYARGFVRLYAAEVGVPPAIALALFDQMTLSQRQAEDAAVARHEGDMRARRRRLGRVRAVYSLAVGAVVAVVLIALFSVSSGPTEARDIVPDAAVSTPRIVPLPVEVVPSPADPRSP